MSDVLLRRREGAVEYLTFNRPERLNALTSQFCHAFADALGKIASDASARRRVQRRGPWVLRRTRHHRAKRGG